MGRILFLTVFFLMSFDKARSYPSCGAPVPTKGLTGERSAYMTDFVQPPGQPWTYVAWVWREGSFVETNHSVSIARTLDFSTWYTTCGQTISLPISLSQSEVIDPVPVGGGLLNNIKLGYDNKSQPVVTYQKYVRLPTGKWTTQIFNARLEGGHWKVYQMTNWTTQWVLSGGGSIQMGPNSVSASAVSVSSRGQNIQSFNRAPVDTVGTPVSGLYALTDKMDVGGKFTEPIDPKSFNWMPPSANYMTLEPRMGGWQTPFLVKKIRSKYFDRWVPLHADWDGDGTVNSGLFDRLTSTFRLNIGKTISRFRFGWQGESFKPMSGDWNGDGIFSIGFFSPSTGRSFLKNSPAGGDADKITTGYPSKGIRDLPDTYHQWNPTNRFFIRWEAMPANRDLPYTCDGAALTSLTPSSEILASCPTHFLSDLTIWEFNRSTNQWTNSFIDKAWGGSSANFDLLTFKNFQVVVYYNRDRYLTVGIRKLGAPWSLKASPVRFGGWDSHNYITVEIDENYQLHIVGNQHASPLNYLKVSNFDVNTLRLAVMTETLNNKVTYPVFFRLSDGQFAFRFREGVSGNGQTYMMKYDTINFKWSMVNPSALFANY